MSAFAAEATRNVSDTLALALEHTSAQTALLIADGRSTLSRVLVAAYSECLPAAKLLYFDDVGAETVKAAFAELGEKDLVVLIQSSVFRIPEYRTRVELFRRGIKVIEHSNLDRISDDEVGHYVAALAYEPAYYRGVGHALKARMDSAASARIESEGECLHVAGPLESAKLNIGHFEGLKNVGSLFPIGEVFTEARELERVHGRVKIYGFTDTSFRLNVPPSPITLSIEGGQVVSALDSTADFDQVLTAIVADEGTVWLRELGFGMNRAFSRERHVGDVGAFERVCGVHLSLGARHGVYKKPHLDRRAARHHVDTFVVTSRVLLDEEVVYAEGAWPTFAARDWVPVGSHLRFQLSTSPPPQPNFPGAIWVRTLERLRRADGDGTFDANNLEHFLVTMQNQPRCAEPTTLLCRTDHAVRNGWARGRSRHRTSLRPTQSASRGHAPCRPAACQ